MRIAIFGANGPTGRLLTGQTVNAGHDTVAVTRRPDAFPISDTRLNVVGGDVLDQRVVDGAIEGCDAVLSTLGVPFGKVPVEVYSHGAEHMLERHEALRRASARCGQFGRSDGRGRADRRLPLQPRLTALCGQETRPDGIRRYAPDGGTGIRSDVDWTIIRPSGLYELPEVTDYSLTEAHGPGRFTARVDLAAAMLRQVDDDRFVGKVGHVITTEANPTVLSMMLHEAFKKS